MAYWLLVERLENRLVDEREGFCRFGIPARQERLAAQVKRGDELIFYVSSGLSMISDIRQAASDGVDKLHRGGDYDTAFPFALLTTPHLILPRDHWLSFKDLAPRLSLTAGKDWRQFMRVSLRRLPTEDGALIMNAVRHRLAT